LFYFQRAICKIIFNRPAKEEHVKIQKVNRHKNELHNIIKGLRLLILLIIINQQESSRKEGSSTTWSRTVRKWESIFWPFVSSSQQSSEKEALGRSLGSLWNLAESK
jgi:hypothetical protein